MAHELMANDNMFSVKETPWHGLGTVLPQAPTVEEALIAANLTWQVRTLNLAAFQPPSQTEFSRTRINMPRFKALQREDTQEVFTVVSDQYRVLQNLDAFNIFRPLVEDGTIELETAGSLQNGKKVWVMAKVKTDSQEVRKGDEIKPYVLLSNSHDGSQAVRFGFTPIRVVCNNTLSASQTHKKAELVRVCHKGDVVGNVEALREMMNAEIDGFEATMADFKKLAKKPINESDMIKYIRKVFPPKAESAEVDIAPVDEDFLDQVIEATGSLAELSRKEEAIMNVLNGGRGAGTWGKKGVTYWDAYNAVNEWGLYERGYSDEGRLSSAWFGTQKVDDQRALSVALKMAA